ncbi:MAG: hypothetical protein VX762_01840 [Bacteroidota bacterium]|nr:hypothetical protein [Bacteroidota bacterium]
MKQNLINIPLVILTMLVVFLSMEFNVSKMRCDEGGTLYLGSEVPSCSEENEVVCIKEQEKVSCCMREVKKSCCPETKDKSCASSTQNIHFDFETVIPVFELDFKEIATLSYTTLLCGKICDLKREANYVKDIPPPKLYKSELAEIQSFLL